ncbi:MAG: phosphoglucomutase/phosphomannomutase family protein [Firmicutes bacterium]|nr:phosphoglucomutase/phosphomannomutase family protein [Bacillota bacterium]
MGGGGEREPVPVRFGTDGWRGIIAEDFTFERVRVVGQAVASFLRAQGEEGRGIVIGYDRRFLSDRFARALAEIAAGNGIHVLMGIAPFPTPVVSWVTRNHGLAAGLMVTASHNPAAYNGIKFKPPYGGAATEEVTARLELEANRMLPEGDRDLPRLPFEEGLASGRISWLDPGDEYLRSVLALVETGAIGRAGLRVAVDVMHGAGAGYLDRAFEEAGAQVRRLRSETNPSFGGVNPEPVVQNLAPLLEGAGSFDLGIATDGDGDRVAMVDEKGNFVDPHRILALLILHLAKGKGQKGAVVRTFSTTSMVDDLARRLGLEFRETPVGFKHICRLMLEEDILVGGEESGGIGVRGHIPERDAVLVALLIAEMMVLQGRTLSELVEDLFRFLGRPYHYRRVDVEVPVERVAGLKEELCGNGVSRIGSQQVDRVERLDGVKYHLADGSWLLLRPSGTEPLIRIYAEAGDEDRAEALVRDGRSLAESLGL